MRKKNIVSFLLCTSMILNLFPYMALGISNPERKNNIVADISFDALATGSEPMVASSVRGAVRVVQPETSILNKAAAFYKMHGILSAAFNVPVSGNCAVYQFDYMFEDNLCEKFITLKDDKSTTTDISHIGYNGEVYVADGRQVAQLDKNRWYRIAAVFNYYVKRYSLYIDGKCVASEIAIDNSKSYGIGRTLVIKGSSSTNEKSTFYIDNIRAYNDAVLYEEDLFEKEEFNPAEAYEPIITEIDEETVYINESFNTLAEASLPSGFDPYPKHDSNVVGAALFPSKSDRSLYIKRTAQGDPLVNCNLNNLNASSVVLEFLYYSPDKSSNNVVLFRDESGKMINIFQVLSGEMAFGNTKFDTLKTNTWYKVAAIIDFASQTITGYIDGELVVQNTGFSNSEFTTPQIMRFTISNVNPGEVYYNDLKLYAGTAIREILDVEEENVEVIETTNSIVSPETTTKLLLKDKIALVKDYGQAYVKNEKVYSSSKARTINNIDYLPLRFIVEGFGGRCEWDLENKSVNVFYNEKNYRFKVDSSNVEGINGNISAPVVMYENNVLVPLSDFVKSVLGKQVAELDRLGLFVIGDEAEKLSTHNLEDIYDYITYARPTSEQILSDFKEYSANIHPRILVRAEDFERIKEQSKTEPNMKKWADDVIAAAEKTLTQEHTRYYKSDGKRLLPMSQQLLSRAKMLGMAYKLTENEKYSEYLWEELNAVCSFADWNPDHYLDTGEMTAGVAIAYDWLFDYWSPERRAIIEEGLLKLGLTPAERSYSGYKYAYDWIRMGNNWVVVCNGGMVMGAVALMDLYPEKCSWIIEQALLSMECMLGEFAPDGGWFEGPGYWSYTIQYTAHLIGTMQSALGTEYGYYKNTPSEKAGYFYAQLSSRNGVFNFSDAAEGLSNTPWTFWIAKANNDGNLSRHRLDYMEKNYIGGTADDLIYFDSSNIAKECKMNLDGIYTYAGAATFRDTYNGDTPLFVGIHGGDNGSNHGHNDAGTFVIHALGEIWASDLGSDDYNINTSTMLRDIYRKSSQGHNTVSLNPKSDYGQIPNAVADITKYVTKERGGFAVVDMSEVFGTSVTEAQRGIKLDNDRSQVVVQDELNLITKNDLWWFMHTKADVDIAKNGKFAILTLNNKQVYVELQSNVKEVRFKEMKAEPLEGTCNVAGQAKNDAYRKLSVNIPKAKGKVIISVRFIPVFGSEMLETLTNKGAEKMRLIEQWDIEEGEILPVALNKIIVDGKELDEFEPDTTAYDIVRTVGVKEAPIVEAMADDRYDVEISKIDSVDGSVGIKVSDKENPYRSKYYTLSFVVPPTVEVPEEYKFIQIINATESEVQQPENPPSAAIDGSMVSRWSCQGDQWLQLELGEIREINCVAIAFYSGSIRSSYFDIEVSDDGVIWNTVYTGHSSGLSDELEVFEIGNTKGKYVRIHGKGNSVNQWNSYTEVQIYGR